MHSRVHPEHLRGCTLTGSVSGILAALTAAVAFTAIKFIPKTEPTIVLAMWFHTSALAMSVVPLAVRLRPCLVEACIDAESPAAA
jgi:drug/metabolite transporter (DMT)-like permease